MNINIYKQIITKRGQDPNEDYKSGFDRVTYSIRQDLGNNKVIWEDDWCTDWYNFIKCNHTLLSIFLVPSQHPFSSNERIVVLLCMTSLAIMWAAISAAIEDTLTGYLISVGGGIINILIHAILIQLATCQCVQSCPFCIRSCFEWIGHQLLIFWSILCLIIFIVALVVSLSEIGTFLLSFIISLGTGWIFGFIPNTIVYAYFRKKEKEDVKLNDNEFIISYLDYNQFKNGEELTREINKNNIERLSEVKTGIEDKKENVKLKVKEKKECLKEDMREVQEMAKEKLEDISNRASEIGSRMSAKMGSMFRKSNKAQDIPDMNTRE